MASSCIHKKDLKPILPLVESESTTAQQGAERECQPYFVELSDLAPDQIDHLRGTGLLASDNNSLNIQLLRQKHVEYLSQVWKRSLRAPFVSLDSSRPWMLYWCLQGCDLLGHVPTQKDQSRMVSTLRQCWQDIKIAYHPFKSLNEDPLYFNGCDASSNVVQQQLEAGGFGGGPGQMAHAATTYAAVLSLCIIATNEGEASQQALQFLKSIRIPLYRWLVSLQQTTSGGYRMHHDGEVDVRASYTIICCAKLLRLATPYLCQHRVVNYIRDCQTFEGGLGGEPWSEAHGGYAFCGVAALQLLGKLHVLDLSALTGWLARRQMSFEGGFSGRSNKLVDGCYSFWQGGAIAIASAMYKSTNTNDNTLEMDPWLEKQKEKSNSNLPFQLLYDAPMLERYILLCAQDVYGGLRDKPSKSRDFYHSCYNLSGLSVAQHCDSEDSVYGDPNQTIVAETHPCYNIRIERVESMSRHRW